METFLFTPNIYNTGVLRALKPNTNVGDFTYARTGGASRRNTQGNSTNVAENVPQIDYTGSECPSLLLEPTRTNLFLNSAVGVTQSITLTANDYTISFKGTGSISVGGQSLNGTGVNDRVSLTFSASAGSSLFTIVGVVAEVNVELGQFSTSWIPTLVSSETRGLPLVTGAGSVDIFNSSEGVLMFKGSALFSSSTASRNISINDGSFTNRINIGYSSASNVIFARLNSLGGGSQRALTFTKNITDSSVVVLRYNSSLIELWVDGAMVDSTNVLLPIQPNTLNTLSLTAGGNSGVFEGRIEQIRYYNSVLTDSEIASLGIIGTSSFSNQGLSSALEMELG